jgi:hypothetical protein
METLTERATGWRSFVDGCQRLACGQRSSFERLVRSVSTLLENSALRTPIEICAARHILASLLARYREVDPETQLKFIKLVIVEDIDTVKLSLARYTPTCA